MLTARHILALLGRELSAYFLAPATYLVLLGFQCIAWLNFWDLVDLLSRPQRSLSATQDPINAYIAGSTPFWFAVLFAVPVLTMRLLAEEKRSGTIEPLLTAPVTEGEIVAAKWLAGVAMYLVLLAPFAVYLPFLYVQGEYAFDLGPLVSLSLGLLTLGMMFVAIGVFASATTRNQMVAAIGTFVALFLLLFLTFIGDRYATERQLPWAPAIRYVALIPQVVSLGTGRLDLRFPIMHLSVCLFMLYLASQALRSRESA